MQSQQSEAFQSSRESIPPADSLNPATETTTDCLQENVPSFDTSGVTDLNTMKPVVAVTRLKLKEGTQLDDKQSETDSTSQDLGISATGSPDENLRLHDEDGGAAAQVSAAQESPAENVSSETTAAAAEESNGEEEVAASQEKKNGTGKAKTPTKRRSGRSTTSRR